MEWRSLIVRVKSLYSNTGATEDYSTLYEVSSEGEIRDAKTKQIIKQKFTKDYPYKFVVLTDINGNKKKRYVHRIVASTFKDICGEYNEVVNHLDENKLNNCANNLQWCTDEENKNYGTAKERARKNYQKYLEKKKIEKELSTQEKIEYISIEPSYFYDRKLHKFVRRGFDK